METTYYVNKEKLLTSFVVCVVLTSLVVIGAADENSTIFNVLDYGANGDGQNDDSQAFLRAWEELCEADNEGDGLDGPPKMEVPGGRTFKLKPVHFQGPCKSKSVKVQVSGTITAPAYMSGWTGCFRNSWIRFSNVSNLIITGSGMLNGRGENWWKTKELSYYNQTFPFLRDAGGCSRPTALHLDNCSNLQVRGLTHVNSPRNHIGIHNSYNVTLSNLNITAPESSPNTDGINTYSTTHVFIHNTTIATGDDCIAIKQNCSHINITGITCGPGHGISVGSLGTSGANESVEEVFVKNCTLIGSMYGLRIKTWQGGSGYASNIHFENIRLMEPSHPIIIDQFYCNGGHGCKNMTKAVAVSNVTYTDVKGTSANKNAITLKCASSTNCTNIRMDHINITWSSSTSFSNHEVLASCMNATGSSSCTTPAVPCLLDYVESSCADNTINQSSVQHLVN